MEEKMNEKGTANTTIKIYPTNWLMAAGIVGFIRILGEESEKYIRDYYIEIPENFIQTAFLDIYSSFLARQKNIIGRIHTFYHNSFLTQIFQKSVRDTLVGRGVPREKAAKLEQFVNNYLKEEKQLKNRLKFLNEETIDQVFPILQKYETLLNNIHQASEKKSKKAKKTKKAKAKKAETENVETEKAELIEQLVQNIKKIVPESKHLENLKSLFYKELKKKLIENAQESEYPCFFCNERKAIYRVHDEGKVIWATLDEIHFTPLGGSPSNLKNFYWEGRPSSFLCLVCELIIYCAAFGFTELSNGKYVFVNAPTTIRELVAINNIWQSFTSTQDNFFQKSLIEILKKIEKIKANWTIQNISFIELNKVPGSKNTYNIYSFHLPGELARVIRKMIQSYPPELQGVYDIFLDYICNKKPLYNIVRHIFYGYISSSNKDFKENKENSNIVKNERTIILDKPILERLFKQGQKLYKAQKIDKLLFFIKFQREVSGMNTNYVDWAFDEGKSVAENLFQKKGEGAKRIIEKFSYRMLEGLRRNDSKIIVESLIRLYDDIENRTIPTFFKEMLKDIENLNQLGYAFVLGINSKRKESGIKVTIEDTNEDTT